MKELKIIELFAGVGSQTQALKNIGIPYKVVAIIEIDKHALKSYSALHLNGDENLLNKLNLGDITKITQLPSADLWTYSFPCQDLSVASHTKLGLKGKRSGLLYEVERLLKIAQIEKSLPKYLLLENVKNLVSKNNICDYYKWITFLTSLGYKNFWKVINAKDYLPQNRERVFCVSILQDEVDNDFVFSNSLKRTTKLSDFLEKTVDEKYYLKRSSFDSILNSNYNSTRCICQTKDYCRTLTARDFHSPAVVLTGNLDARILNLLLKMTDIKRGGVKLCQIKEPIIVAQRGRNLENQSDRTSGIKTIQCFEPNYKGICNTLTTVQKDNFVCEFLAKNAYTVQEIFEGLSLRKLTEREYWRLMGWKDEQIDKLKNAKIFKSQMYRQAGNGIVLPILESIFAQLFAVNELTNAA